MAEEIISQFDTSVYIKGLFPGIYGIRNIVNDKRYIGSSIFPVWRRWNKHKRTLALGRKCPKKLLHAWRKYGADNFEFSLIESLGNKGKVRPQKVRQKMSIGMSKFMSDSKNRKLRSAAMKLSWAKRKHSN